jgi:hypothetical protein
VVLADAEDVKANLVGQFNLFDEVAKALRRTGLRVAPVTGSEIAAAKLSMPICIVVAPGRPWLTQRYRYSMHRHSDNVTSNWAVRRPNGR